MAPIPTANRQICDHADTESLDRARSVVQSTCVLARQLLCDCVRKLSPKVGRAHIGKIVYRGCLVSWMPASILWSPGWSVPAPRPCSSPCLSSLPFLYCFLPVGQQRATVRDWNDRCDAGCKNTHHFPEFVASHRAGRCISSHCTSHRRRSQNQWLVVVASYVHFFFSRNQGFDTDTCKSLKFVEDD